jgi:hypothetical protein
VWPGEKETFKEKFGSFAREIFNLCTTKGICTRNITHNTENTAV